MSRSRRVFLTGATGFIGRRVAARLVQGGDRLVCLVRNPDNARTLTAAGAELIVGDVADPPVVARGIEGADAAIHLAGLYDVGVVDGTAMRRTNVDGTRVFLEAAAHAVIPRAIHVSSTAALGPSTEGEAPIDVEWTGPYPSVYHETKAEAHRLARAAMSAVPGLMIVCPAFGIGPGDEGPSGRFIRDLVHGRVPGLLARPGWYSWVHGDDIAEGLVLALERGTPGATYALTGENASINDFAIRVSKLAGRRPPPLRMPVGLALALGSMLDGVSRLTGARFTISRESVATSALRWLHDGERTRRDLGWAARRIDEVLPAVVEAYR
jgi:dihydroflavonol-4-reductase